MRVTMPLPWALDHVHCYALAGDDGWTLIDAGLGTERDAGLVAARCWTAWAARCGGS